MARDETEILCDLCNERLIKKHEWFALNRYVINAAPGYQMSSIIADDGYIWQPDDSRFSGRSLCYPHCLFRWIDGAMIEIRSNYRKGKKQ